MATCTSKYPIGWHFPPAPAPPVKAGGFAFTLEMAMRRAQPVQAVLVRHFPTPTFLVLGAKLGATVEAAGLDPDQFRSRMFAYPDGREAFDVASRAEGYDDLDLDDT